MAGQDSALSVTTEPAHPQHHQVPTTFPPWGLPSRHPDRKGNPVHRNLTGAALVAALAALVCPWAASAHTATVTVDCAAGHAATQNFDAPPGSPLNWTRTVDGQPSGAGQVPLAAHIDVAWTPPLYGTHTVSWRLTWNTGGESGTATSPTVTLACAAAPPPPAPVAPAAPAGTPGAAVRRAPAVAGRGLRPGHRCDTGCARPGGEPRGSRGGRLGPPWAAASRAASRPASRTRSR